MPSGPNASRPPSWMKPFGMPASTTSGSPISAEASASSRTARTTRLSSAVVT